LSAYVFHSRNWDDDKLDAANIVSNTVVSTKELLKGVCIHEVMANKSDAEGESLSVCPKVVTDRKADEAIAKFASAAAAVAIVTSTVTSKNDKNENSK
jgi:hypothetical protein